MTVGASGRLDTGRCGYQFVPGGTIVGATIPVVTEVARAAQVIIAGAT